jgi:hypothetical protein
MDNKIIKLKKNNKNYIKGVLTIWEEAPNNENYVMLELKFENNCYKILQENFFLALIDLRKILEKSNIQICCNGAAKNVYPSNMQMSMGDCLYAYKIYLKKTAQKKDIVNIFDCDNTLEFVSINVQNNFYKKWINSVLE